MRLIVCTLCSVEKPVGNFPVEEWGVRRQCRPCRVAQKRRARHRQSPAARAARLAKARDYGKRNAEKLAEDAKNYRAAHSERLKQYFKAHYQRNKEHKKALASNWRKANPERRRELNKRWASENPQAALAHYRSSKRKRRHDPKIRLFDSISAQIREALRNAKDGRRWESLVGFSRADLVTHLERQFTDEMNWENYGEWHIDHVVPASSYGYATPADSDFRACWALTNLRPMWALDNISKGARRLHLL